MDFCDMVVSTSVLGKIAKICTLKKTMCYLFIREIKQLYEKDQADRIF